eukprot:scaffold358_cov256-Pinguiococcus_pyrenoidosus.AAC.22
MAVDASGAVRQGAGQDARDADGPSADDEEDLDDAMDDADGGGDEQQADEDDDDFGLDDSDGAGDAENLDEDDGNAAEDAGNGAEDAEAQAPAPAGPGEDKRKPATKAAKKRPDISRFIDNEAEDEDDDSDAGEESDEDEEGENEYKKDGFVVGSDVEDEDDDDRRDGDSDSDSELERRRFDRLKRKRRSAAVDEDDLELLEENAEKGPLSKRHRGEEADDSAPRPSIRAGNIDDLGDKIFDGDDNESPSKADRPMREAVDYDSEDDFIVDDYDDEGGQPDRPQRKRPRRPALRLGGEEGPTQEQLNEAEDVFGGILGDEFLTGYDGEGVLNPEDDEGEDGPAMVKEGRRAKRDLRKNYEPSQLAEHFLLEKDDELREKDVPERLQSRLEGRGEIMAVDRNHERRQEAEWILEQLENLRTTGRNEVEQQAAAIVAIKKALELIQEDHEVNFIWHYRKDFFYPTLNREHLWKIFDLDEKWERLTLRRLELEKVEAPELFKVADVLSVGDEEKGILRKEIALIQERYLEGPESLVRTARSEEELKDVYEFLALRRGLGTSSLGDGGTRRIDWDAHRRCVQAGLRNALMSFCAPAVMVGARLEAMEMSREVRDEWISPSPPQESNMQFRENVGEDFRTPQDVIKGVVVMAALELSTEPTIRAWARRVFRRYASISTSMTKRGREDITELGHPAYGYQAITKKPVQELLRSPNRFDRELFLRILAFERKKLIAYTIHGAEKVDNIEDEKTGEMMERTVPDFSPFVDPIKKALLPLDLVEDLWADAGPEDENKEEIRREYDKIRERIARRCVRKHLIPYLERELRRELAQEGQKYVVEAAGEKLRDIALRGPYISRDDLQKGNRILKTWPPRYSVLAACVGEQNRDLNEVVVVDGYGTIQKTFQYANGALGAEVLLKQLVRDYVPYVAVVSSFGGLRARRLQRFLAKTIEEAAKQVKDGWAKKEEHDSDYIYDDDLGSGSTAHKDYSCEVLFEPVRAHQIFAHSPRSNAQTENLSRSARMALGAARYIQDPLVELCSMFNVFNAGGKDFGQEILSLNLHELQWMLPAKPLTKKYDMILQDCVADVGVDINACVQREHLLGPLAFVPGLGIRKATALRSAILQRGGSLMKRTEILENGLMDNLVHTECIGFLRIVDAHPLKLGFTDDYSEAPEFHPLDATRIHHEMYIKNDWIFRMCKAAYGEAADPDGLDSNITDGLAPETIITRVMTDSHEQLKLVLAKDITFSPSDEETRSRIRQQGLTYDELLGQMIIIPGQDDEQNEKAFANLLKSEYNVNVRYQLEMALDELRFPFLDPREPYRGPGAADVFEALTGETVRSLYPGCIRTCSVIEVNRDRRNVRVELDSGIFGSISFRNLGDQDASPPPVNAVLQAIVVGIEKNNFLVRLSLRPEDFEKSPTLLVNEEEERRRRSERFDDNRPRMYVAEDLALPELPLDAQYLDLLVMDEVVADHRASVISSVKEMQKVIQDAQGPEDRDAEKGPARRQGWTARALQHDNFQNITSKQAEKDLAGKERGSFIIRPSTRGDTALAITWAFLEGVFKHIEVEEVGQKAGNVGLAQKLRIKDEEYEDLDEVIASLILPMNDYVSQMLGHAKYKRGDRESVESALKAAYKREPTRVPYFFRRSESRPGVFNLCYIYKKLRNEIVTVDRQGFRYMKKHFTEVDSLIAHFKQNFNKKQQQERAEREAARAALSTSSQPPPPSRPSTQAAPREGERRRRRWDSPPANREPVREARPPAPVAPPPPVPLPIPVAAAPMQAAPPAYTGQLPFAPPRPPSGMPGYPAPALQMPSGAPQMPLTALAPPPPPPPPSNPYGSMPMPPRAAIPPGLPAQQPPQGRGRGRGRGSTLPAWMTQMQSSTEEQRAAEQQAEDFLKHF